MQVRLAARCIVFALLGMAACFPSLDGLTGSDASASDGAAPRGDSDSASEDPDGGAREVSLPDAPDSAKLDATSVDSGPTVPIPNPGFEQTGTGCGPGWNGSNATLQTSPNARSGALACRICRLGNPGAIQSAPMGIPAGPGKYRLSVWLRNSSTHPSSPNIVTSLMAMQGQLGIGGQPKAAVPMADYEEVTFDYTAPPGTDNLVIQMQNAAGADNSCFVIDDVSIERVP